MKILIQIPLGICKRWSLSALRILVKMIIEVKVTVTPKIALVISKDVFCVPHLFFKYCSFLQKMDLYNTAEKYLYVV